MAESFALPTSSITEVEGPSDTRSPAVKLKLKKPKNNRKVKWTEETVDNEHMDKKKSKCCCIYEKPKLFGESSSEDEDDECGHCRGHKKKCYQSKPNPDDHSADKPADPGSAPDNT